MTWRSATFLIWGVLGLATLTVLLFSLLGKGRLARPAELLGPVQAHPMLRIAVVLGWMWLGWHFFAR
ncbi:MAG: DUF6186 family protein [Actinomycetota bacterium]|nr:DUF6186 family protein [Actinomycetota bacterium]